MADPVIEPIVPVVDPVVEPAVVEPAATEPSLHTDTPTLLQDFDKPAETPAEPAPAETPAPAEAPKPDEPAKPADPVVEVKPPEPVAPTPVAYTDFKLPDGFTKDDAKLGTFRDTLGKFGVPQDSAQGLIDLHAGAMQTYATALQQAQHDTFAQTRAGWRQEAKADPEIGGAGHMTAMAAIARMRDLAITAAERPAFDNFLAVTGAGDHPVFLKMLHRFARHFDEPALPPPNARPTAANGMTKPGARVLYDNPRSNPGGRQ